MSDHLTTRLTDGVITLRPLDLDDVERHLAGEDEELARWLNGGPGTIETVHTYVEHTMQLWAAGGPIFTFGICLNSDATLVGTMDVQLHRPYLREDQANLAYGLYPTWRGQGLATRAVLLAISFLNERTDITEAVIRTEPGNPSSAAVARRAGFRFSHSADDGEGTYEWYLRTVS